MARLTLLELTGSADAAALAASWPHDSIRPEREGDYDEAGAARLIEHLELVLRFDAIRSFVAQDGAGSAISLTADLFVDLQNDAQGPLGAVHRNLSDFTLRLARMDAGRPAKLQWTRFADGTSEVALLGLPIELYLPLDLLMAPFDLPEDNGGFDPTRSDSLGIRLETGQVPSVLSFFASLRITRAGEVLMAPNVPLSIGRCLFMGLPCRAVHDLAFQPDVALAAPALVRELSLGWAQPIGPSPEDLSWDSVLANRLGGDGGLMSVRTLDLDRAANSIRQVYEFLAANDGPSPKPLEIPLEDLALAFDAEGGIPLPAYPIFGMTGLRRQVNDDTAAAEPFDHTLAPIIVPLKLARGGDAAWAYMHVHRLLLGWTDQPLVSFDLAITRDRETPTVNAVTVNFTQDYILRVGWAAAAPVGLFKVGNTRMSLLAVRGGINFGKLLGPDPGLLDVGEAMADFAIVSADDHSGDTIAFTSRSGGKLDVVLRDVGWKAGAPSIALWTPEGVDLSVLGKGGFRIDEIGLATTTHGASYLRLSASYRVGGQVPVAGHEAATHPHGSGIWVRGLRIRIGDHEGVDAPALAIDGIVLSLQARKFAIEGGGWLRDEVIGGNRLRELGFGIKVTAPLGANSFILGGLFVLGSLEAPASKIDYLLAGVSFGPIPFGSFVLLRGAVLIARNYLPSLPAPTGVEQNLRMLHWYRAQPDGLALPPSRVLGAWEPHPDSWAIGISARLGLGNSGKVKLDAFGLFLKSPETWSLLVGLELRWDERPDPIGWLAVEYDDASGRWAATGGLSLSVKDVLRYDKLPDFAEVSGAVFVSNSPRTVALGHIEDVDSWLQFKVQYDSFNLLLRIGLCFYDYDGEVPVNALGFVVTGRGKTKIKRFAEFSFLLEVTVLLGSFSSDGLTSGVLATVTAAFRIRVWRINFGISGRIEVEQIHPEPDSGRATVDLRIETPWFLPDIHFEHTWHFGDDPAMDGARVVSLPVSGGQAIAGAGDRVTDLAAPLPAGADALTRPYSVAEVDALGPPPLAADAFDALAPVAVDSIIAIDFAAAIANKLGIGEATPAGASRQQNGELHCDYELIEIGIRRRPRFGAGGWTALLDPQATSTAAIDPATASASELEASFTSQIALKWDRDHVRAGKLDARRLLINAATPFTLTAANPMADEALLDDTDATCCGRKSPRPWRRLDFEDDAPGRRLPRVGVFPGGSARVRWHGLLPPVVTEDEGRHWARLPLAGRVGQELAAIRFDRPASRVALRLAWSKPMAALVRIELHRGLRLVTAQTIALDDQLDRTIELPVEGGADRWTIRLAGGADPLGALYCDLLAFCDRVEETQWLLGLARCGAGGVLASDSFAWLPNHDYEVAVTCRTLVGHDRLGEVGAPVTQTVLFRTKAWPGLNAPETPGADLAPFIEAQYPARPVQLLYRSEPVLLVMNERFTPLAPAVDAPASAPPERRQLVQYSMLVDRLGGMNGGSVATFASPDWLTAHRNTGGPAGPTGARGDAVLSHLRLAESLDPRMIRLDTVRASPASCQTVGLPLNSSRIYACPPPPEGWAHGTYRARVVQRGGPFVMRPRFEADDLTAFTRSAEGGGSLDWTIAEDGVLVAPAGPDRAMAALGDPAWMHLEIRADVDPADGIAGVAVAVSGNDALLAILEPAAGEIRLERRLGGTTEVIGQAPLPADAAPYSLELVAYDDAIIARLADIELRADRGAQREGRVALVGSGGARFASLAVEPLEAYALDLTTSRWQRFEDQVAAYDTGAPVAIAATHAEASAWLSANWDAVAAAMTPEGDARSRDRLFREALEAFGLPAIDDPAEPLLSLLRAEGAGLGVLIEGPEPLPVSRDVAIQMHRRRRQRPPFGGGGHLPLDGGILADRAARLTGRKLRSDVAARGRDVVTLPDRDLFPAEPAQWIEVPCLAISDAAERRLIVLPVDTAQHTLAALPGSFRLDFALDRERYRSDVPDPQARTTASASRMI